jgi:glycosyltransferase involved in cell wall biosynthesis
MRIAIDYTAGIDQPAGIGRYARNLAAALARVDAADRFTLFSSEPPHPDRGFPVAPNIRARVLPVGNRFMTIAWHRLRLPLPAEAVMGWADVVHGPDFTLPPALRARRVVTIHDLAYLTHPQCALPSLVTYLSRVVPRALHAADRVIANSQRTADELRRYYDVPPERVRVIYLGFDPAFAGAVDPAAVERVRARYGLERPTVLAVGTIEPRKNYAGLLTAFAQARRRPEGPRRLVIAGRKGWLYEGVFETARQLNLGDAVTFLDFVADADLAALYHAADVLAMPSLSEGFGIPVLEAMACGTPVVCSDGGALPEVAGDAALLVPPEDVDALAAALVRAVSDDALRQLLRARGYAQARRFSWDEAAREHVRVYHEAAKGANR